MWDKLKHTDDEEIEIGWFRELLYEVEQQKRYQVVFSCGYGVVRNCDVGDIRDDAAIRV